MFVPTRPFTKLTAVLFAFTFCTYLLAQTTTPVPFRQKADFKGIEVELQVDHMDQTDPNKIPGRFQEGDNLNIRFLIKDSTDTPLKSLYPAVWMEPQLAGQSKSSCTQKVKTFLSGSLFSKAEIDLNVFYVVVLNRDGTVTVVDPLFSFGKSKLLAMVELESPGEDWVMSPNQNFLYVTMPEVQKLAVIDTRSWKVVNSVATGVKPERILLSPDGHYLWLAHRGSQTQPSGVVALTRESGEISAHIATGAGYHDLAMDRDNRSLFVSNAEAGTVSVIDVASLSKTQDLPTGSRPVSLTYSDVARSLLVADEKDGTIVAVNGKTFAISARMTAEPGVRQVAYAPQGRFAFAINPLTDQLHIVDSASNSIIQSGNVADRPSQVAFSEELAYIFHEGEEVAYMVPLREIGVQGKPISLVDIPAGRFPVAPAGKDTLVTGMACAPVEPAVMFPNPKDQSIYYYQEGMAAPMGQFKNYGHTPKALLVLDRSLQEQEVPGLYVSTTKVGKPGNYDVVFFLENPRVVHCFQLPVQADPEREALRRASQVKLEYLPQDKRVPIGPAVPVRFRITGWDGSPFLGLTDASVRYICGGWHRKVKAVEVEAGIYEVNLTFPKAGFYFVNPSSPTAGLRGQNVKALVLQAIDQSAKATDSNASNQETPTQGAPK